LVHHCEGSAQAAYADPTSLTVRSLRAVTPARAGCGDRATGLAFGYVMNHIKEGEPDLRAAVLVDVMRTAMKGI
jgi:hypothetical protein